MTNIHLERDTKETRFKEMIWERNEKSNEIIATDHSVHHHYKYKNRKTLNRDWYELIPLIKK